MKEGHYCVDCHPNGKELETRHKQDPFNKKKIGWFKVCSKCELMKPTWYWAGEEHERDVID